MGSRSKSSIYISRGSSRRPARESQSRIVSRGIVDKKSNRNPALSPGNYTGQRNTFISFSMRNVNQVKLLRFQAKDERNELRFRDYSAKEKFDEKWKTQMKEKMKLCSRTICMVGEDTHSRKAVIWELNTAYKLGHKVIGVRIYKDENHKMPEPLLRNKARIITWNMGDLMEQLNTE